MQVQEQKIKVILGLKLRKYREEKKLSTQSLATKSGLSASYINEIEKGRKYPKADKIFALAGALGVDYDDLVSLKLENQLEQLSGVLKSDVLQDIPLDLFGIETSDLIGFMGDDPAKFSALIQTFLEIARNYDVQVEHFLLATLRSYQELHHNYFEDLEEAAQAFLTQHNWLDLPTIEYEKLKQLLVNNYDYEIIENSFEDYPSLQGLRSVYVPGGKRKLIINRRLLPSQKAFVLGRELGYLILNLKERALTSSWIQVESFEQVLNNFKASYFSGAILLNRSALVNQLQNFFNEKTWNAEAFLGIMEYFDATPETFIHRLTQLLPRYFGLEKLFFLRFHSNKSANHLQLTKELHLSQLHNPHRINKSEHYCRRWITSALLQDLAQSKQQNSRHTLTGIQRSHFYETKNEYLVFSIARPLALSSESNSCVTLGLQIDTKLKENIAFWNDEAVTTRIVNESCERCGIKDCLERVAKPKIYNEKQKTLGRKESLADFLENYS